ncbi:mucin-19 isoform X2 [Orussus abietinus]|uniref:mucin-19 isoform X2 n=1 Tax=Orussus abietinus TaxID=222816 RepID=UPI000626715F|nr:mucin-19 isoform X2 [Orussus abietinus]
MATTFRGVALLCAVALVSACQQETTSPGREVLCYTSRNNPKLLDGVLCKCTTLVHLGHYLHNLTSSEARRIRESSKEVNPVLQVVLLVNDPEAVLQQSGNARQEAAARLANVLAEVDGVELEVAAGSKERLGSFVKTLRDELVRKDQEKRILLRLPTRAEDLAKQFDLKTLSKYVDLFTLPTHHLVGRNADFRTYHPSRLMGLFDMLNTDSLVDLVEGLGAPQRKILVSLPARALKFALKNAEDNVPRSATLQKKPTPVDRAQLCSILRQGEWTVERDEDLTAPYAFRNTSWIAFEDRISAGIKAKYVLLRDLAGLAIHDVEDDVDNDCGKTITEEVHGAFSTMKRKSRQAVLSSLEDDIQGSELSYPGAVKSSDFRISRVVDTEGNIQAVRENTQTEFACPKQGYFVHPKSCNRFYRCVKFNQEVEDYSVFEFDCPAGLAFDEITEVCVWPGSLPEGSPCPGSSEIAPSTKESFKCPGQAGYYADPNNCRWFYACVDLGGGEFSAYEFRCPYGLVFDEQKLVCEWPWLVPNCASPEYQGHGSSSGSAGTGGSGYYGGSGGQDQNGFGGSNYPGSGYDQNGGVGYGQDGLGGSNYPGAGYDNSGLVGSNYPSGSGTPGHPGSGYPGLTGQEYPGSGEDHSGGSYPGPGSGYPGSGASVPRYPNQGGFDSGYPDSGSAHPGSFDTGNQIPTSGPAYVGAVGGGFTGSGHSGTTFGGFATGHSGVGKTQYPGSPGFSPGSGDTGFGQGSQAGSSGFTASTGHFGTSAFGATSGVHSSGSTYQGSAGTTSAHGNSVFPGGKTIYPLGVPGTVPGKTYTFSGETSGTQNVHTTGIYGSGDTSSGFDGAVKGGPTIIHRPPATGTSVYYDNTGSTGGFTAGGGTTYHGTYGNSGFGTTAGTAGTSGAIYPGKSVHGTISTQDSTSGTLATHGDVSGTVYTGTTNQGQVITGASRPGFVETSAGTPGYTITEGVKTVFAGSSTPGTLVHSPSSPGVFLTGNTAPGTVLKGDASPGVVLTGTTSPGTYTGGVAHPGVAINGAAGTTGGYGTQFTGVHGGTGQTHFTGSGGTSIYQGTSSGTTVFDVSKTGGYGTTSHVDTGYKTNEYHDNGGRGTIRYNNGDVTNKFSENDLHDYRTSHVTVTESGTTIVGMGSTGYALVPAAGGEYTRGGFTKTGATKTGITVAQLGGSGGYVTGTGGPRPRPNPDNIGEKAFEGNVGYTGGSTPGFQNSLETATPVVGLKTPTSTGGGAPGVTYAPGVVPLGTGTTTGTKSAGVVTSGTGYSGPSRVDLGSSTGYSYTRPVVPLGTTQPRYPTGPGTTVHQTGFSGTGFATSTSGSVSEASSGYSGPTRFEGTSFSGPEVQLSTDGEIGAGVFKVAAPQDTTSSPFLDVQVYNRPNLGPATQGPVVSSTFGYREGTSGYQGTGYDVSGGSGVSTTLRPLVPTVTPITYSSGTRKTYRPSTLIPGGSNTGGYPEEDLQSGGPTTPQPVLKIDLSLQPGPGQQSTLAPEVPANSIGGITYKQPSVGITYKQSTPQPSTVAPPTGPQGYTYRKPSVPFTTPAGYSTPGRGRPTNGLDTSTGGGSPTDLVATIPRDEVEKLITNYNRGTVKYTPSVYDFGGDLETKYPKTDEEGQTFGSTSTGYYSTTPRYQGTGYAVKGGGGSSVTADVEYTGSSGSVYKGVPLGGVTYSSTTPKYFESGGTDLGTGFGLKETTYSSTPGTRYYDATGPSLDTGFPVKQTGTFGTVYKEAGFGGYSTTGAPTFYRTTGTLGGRVSSSSTGTGTDCSDSYVTSTLSPISRTGTPVVTTYSGGYSLGPSTTPTTGVTLKNLGGKIVVKLSDLHPLLLGKLGAQCSCSADPFEVIRDLGRKSLKVNSSKGEVDLANYDESDVYVDTEVDQEKSYESDESEYTTGVKSQGTTPKTPDSSIIRVGTIPGPSTVRSRSISSRGPGDSSLSGELTLNGPGRRSRKGKLLGDGNSGNRLDASGKPFNIGSLHVLGSSEEDDSGLQVGAECARPGLFRHPRYCDKFYVCHWDEKKKAFSLNVMKCPIHLTFDSEAGACNWPSKGPVCQDGNLLV